MQNVTSLVLSQSGSPLMVPNELRDAASLSVAYTVNGSPLTLTVSVIGIKKAAGEVGAIDTFTYSGVASVTRTISLSDTFDSFRFCAVWSGGSNVSVAVTVTSTGSGAAFDSTQLPAVQTYNVA